MKHPVVEWHGDQLKQHVRDNAQAACRVAARQVLQKAVARCPKKSGAVAASGRIEVYSSPQRIGAVVVFGGTPTTFHVTFVELGTPGMVYRRGSRKGSPRTPVEANPFIRPAARASRGTIRGIIAGRGFTVR